MIGVCLALHPEGYWSQDITVEESPSSQIARAPNALIAVITPNQAAVSSAIGTDDGCKVLPPARASLAYSFRIMNPAAALW